MKKPASESSSEPELVIVLVDTAGNYYELSRAMLEKSRVPDDRKEHVKEALVNVLSESGYINNPRIPGSIVATFVVAERALQYAGSYLSSGKSKR